MYKSIVFDLGGVMIDFDPRGYLVDRLCNAETEEEAENDQLVILSVGEDDEGEYLDVVEDDETLLEVSKLFEKRLSDQFEIE